MTLPESLVSAMAAASRARRRADGCFARKRRASKRELEGMIAKARRIGVPAALKQEWRSWPLERRMWFIGRLRGRLRSPHERPETPFSSNVEPFDYGSARARSIVSELNRGLDSRHKRAQLKPSCQGVIWRGQLWYWAPHRKRGQPCGYQLGVYKPGVGRAIGAWRR